MKVFEENKPERYDGINKFEGVYCFLVDFISIFFFLIISLFKSSTDEVMQTLVLVLAKGVFGTILADRTFLKVF